MTPPVSGLLSGLLWLPAATTSDGDPAAEPPAVAAPAAAPPPIPALSPVYETIVTAPAPGAQAPRADSIAAASVVFPADSPRAFDDLGDLLVEVPGVTVTRSGGIGDFATLSLRGSNPDEVRFYVDGVPLAVAAGGSIDLSTLPLGDVERIEIYRGTTPIGFAESALGGIVSITTRAPAGGARSTLRAGAGSFGTRYGDGTASGSAGRLHVYAGLHAIEADGFDYLNDRGTVANPTDNLDAFRQNNHLAQLDGAARATVDLPGRRQLGVGVIAFGRRHGLPGMGIDPTLRAHFDTTRGIAYASYDARDDLGAGSRLHAQLFASQTRDRFSDPDGKIGAIAALTEDTTISTGATISASRPFTEWARAAVMTEARRETFQPTNQLDVAPVGVPAERLVGAGGVEIGLWSRRFDLDVVPSVRAEVVRDVVTGRDALFERQRPASAPITRVLPVARLGLARPLSPHVDLKANAGRYGRAPSFLELYGDTGALLGNPLLRPEIGWTVDAAAEYRAGGDGGKRRAPRAIGTVRGARRRSHRMGAGLLLEGARRQHRPGAHLGRRAGSGRRLRAARADHRAGDLPRRARRQRRARAPGKTAAVAAARARLPAPAAATPRARSPAGGGRLRRGRRSGWRLLRQRQHRAAGRAAVAGRRRRGRRAARRPAGRRQRQEPHRLARARGPAVPAAGAFGLSISHVVQRNDKGVTS